MQSLRLSAFALIVVVLLVSTLGSGVAVPAPDEGNGLTANETATLWSHDEDAFISDREYRDRFGEDRPAIAGLANATDITFKTPPTTAARWTKHDFADLSPGDESVSVYPQGAERRNGTFVRDAHATIFAVSPSTRAHLAPDETPLYVTRQGTLSGFIDYRLAPSLVTAQEAVPGEGPVSHRIGRIRLKQGERVIATANGTHTPSLEYELNGSGRTTLTLEADIRTRVDGSALSQVNGTRVSGIETTTVTVTDSVPVTIYSLDPEVHTATYPNGDTGFAFFQSVPWQGYSLTADGDGARGVWRFYTARDREWDTLVRSSGEGTETMDSDARPVYVHAYPSRIGPRVTPVRDGPTLLSVWGITRDAPSETYGENVNIESVSEPYTPSYGLALRAPVFDREAVTVHGIVRGTNTTISAFTNHQRIRESRLTATVVEHNDSQARVRLELRDVETGDPIALQDEQRRRIIGTPGRSGYVTIGDKQVKTNASGVAMVTLSEPGIYRARYHPGSWLSHNVAYTSSSQTIRWHPLTSIDGWFSLLIEVGWQAVPFLVTYYAGTRLLRIFGMNDFTKR